MADAGRPPRAISRPPVRPERDRPPPGWIFEDGEAGRLLTELRFRPELVDHLDRSLRKLGNSSERDEFLTLAAEWFAAEGPVLPECRSDFQAALAVAGLPWLVARHRDRNLPFTITLATAHDLQRRMFESREKSGKWEYTRLNWFANHIHRDLLEIGRLQFLPARCPLPYRIYKQTQNRGEVFALPEAGLNCSPAGWIEDGPGFVTTLHEDDVGVTGHPVDFATGRIQRRLVRLERNEFLLRLARNQPVLDVHIPAGPGLTREACERSLHEASAVFTRHFSEIDWKAFVCTSWLLDRELWKCLPDDSNIIAFAALFRPLARPDANARQLFERVFESTGDWRSFPAQTRLQKSVLNHLSNGGTFREASGFILREEDMR